MLILLKTKEMEWFIVLRRANPFFIGPKKKKKKKKRKRKEKKRKKNNNVISWFHMYLDYILSISRMW